MRRIALVPLALLLAVCEPAPLYLNVTRAGSGLIGEVYEKWWFGLKSSEVPCVHDVTLTRVSDGKVIWRTVILHPMDHQCSDTRSFAVGRAPNGFYDEVPLTTPLSSGDYMLTAKGIGSGSLNFTWPLPA